MAVALGAALRVGTTTGRWDTDVGSGRRRVAGRVAVCSGERQTAGVATRVLGPHGRTAGCHARARQGPPASSATVATTEVVRQRHVHTS